MHVTKTTKRFKDNKKELKKQKKNRAKIKKLIQNTWKQKQKQTNWSCKQKVITQCTTHNAILTVFNSISQ